jgi:hypothetical protein
MSVAHTDKLIDGISQVLFQHGKRHVLVDTTWRLGRGEWSLGYVMLVAIGIHGPKLENETD